MFPLPSPGAGTFRAGLPGAAQANLGQKGDIQLKTSDFDFYLPEELIAQHPLERRDASRLMALDKNTGAVSHHHFYDLPQFLRPGDCLVLNNSRVLPARLIGHRLPGGGACEVLLLTDKGDGLWECLVRPGRKLKPGAQVVFGDGSRLTATVEAEVSGGNRLVRFHYEGIFLEVLEELGKMPPPPLHQGGAPGQRAVSDCLLQDQRLRRRPHRRPPFHPGAFKAGRGHGGEAVLRHPPCGPGYLPPGEAEDISEHEMHSEYCMISDEVARTINETKRNGGRVICVGTTSCRTIESFAAEDGTLQESAGWTNIFIYPGYRFKVLDGLITNFHLPESTLIMLVSASGGPGARPERLCRGGEGALPVL